MKKLRGPLSRKCFQKDYLSGQATIEYILLTALVVGILLSAFHRQINTFLNNFKSRKTQYQEVVQQKNLGIPIAWFGGRYGKIGDGLGGGGYTSGATAGSGQNAGEANQGDGSGANENPNNGGVNSGNNAGNNPRNNKKDGESGGDDGDGDNQGGVNAGRRQTGGNADSSSDMAFNKSGSKNKTKTRGRGMGDDGLDGGSDSEESEEGRRGRRTSATDIRGEGSIGDASKNETKEKKEEDQAKAKEKTKERQADEELKKQKQLYGSNKEKTGAGGCSKVDTSAIIKIVLIVGLLFFLAGMLFQKRGDGQD